jgi:hypothetical protein
VIKRAENPDKTFADVVGVDEAKGDLQEIVMYLKDPKKFTRLGGKLPKGVSECCGWIIAVTLLVHRADGYTHGIGHSVRMPAKLVVSSGSIRVCAHSSLTA